MESEWIWWLAGIGTLSGLGLAAGLARYRLPKVTPWFRRGVGVAFVVLLAVTGSYVAACPGCTSRMSYDSARSLDLMLAVFWGSLSVLAILSVSWAGEVVAALVRRAVSTSPEPNG